MPLTRADFDTVPVDTVDSRTGVGDLTFDVQAQALQRGPLAVAGRVEWKLPTGDFDPSVYSAPISEGQSDVAVLGSLGLSLFPGAYFNVEAGWKFRFENSDNDSQPGDEFIFVLEAGFHFPKGLMGKIALDGLVGEPGDSHQFEATEVIPRRRLYSVWGGLLWSAPESTLLELDLRYFLAGEDYPTGIQIFGAVTHRFRLFGG